MEVNTVDFPETLRTPHELITDLHRSLRRVRLLLAMAVLVGAAEARASGNYSTSLLSLSFRYTFAEHTRKDFVSAEQGEEYMAEHDRDLKVRFLAFQREAQRLIADAQKSGTPVGAYDLLLPAVRLPKAGLSSKLAKAAYPLNLVLDVSTESADAKFEITATRPWTAAQLTSLARALKAISSTPPNNEYSDERTDFHHANVFRAGAEVVQAPIAFSCR